MGRVPDKLGFDDLPILDADWVVRDMGHDVEGYREVAAMFIEDLPILRARLALSASSTPAALVAVIHEVANSLGVIGARRGAARVRMTERCLREGSDMDMLAIERVAVEDLSSAESALQAWLAASPGL
jgi:hypothetical protein